MPFVRPVVELLLAIKNRIETGDNPDMKAVFDLLYEELETVQDAMDEMPGMQNHIRTIIYIVIALIDEELIFSKWKYKDMWRDRPMEMEVFGKSVAGENFFRLLKTHALDNPVLAEIFYLCLALGFRKTDTRNAEYREILYEKLPGRLPDGDRVLSPGAEKAIPGENRTLPPLFGLMALLVVLVVSIGAYTMASQWLWNDAARVIHEVAVTVTAPGTGQ
jgi:type IV/VI secretion system ImpK/VasF family protein